MTDLSKYLYLNDHSARILTINLTNLTLVGSFLEIKNLDKVFKLIQNGENVTLITLPGGGRTRLGSILTTKEILEENIGLEPLKKNIFVYLDQSVGVENIEEQLLVNLHSHIKSNNIRKAATELLNSKYSLNLVIDNFKYDPEFLKLLNILKSILHYDLKIISLSLLSDFIDLEKELHSVNTFSYLFHNVVEIPYLNTSDVAEWIKGRSNELDLKLPVGVERQLSEFCGGVPRLLKNYLRAYRKYGDCNMVESSKEILLTMKTLFSQFSEREQSFLRKSVISKKIDSSDQEILKYFKELNVIDNNKLYGKWIINVVRDQMNKKLEVKNGILLLDSYDISNQFTDSEVTFISSLLNSKLVERSSIPRIIGSNEYSDWAIDKFVSRLRQKLTSVGLEGNVIETVKKKGFKLNRGD